MILGQLVLLFVKNNLIGSRWAILITIKVNFYKPDWLKIVENSGFVVLESVVGFGEWDIYLGKKEYIMYIIIEQLPPIEEGS